MVIIFTDELSEEASVLLKYVYFYIRLYRKKSKIILTGHLDILSIYFIVF